jgi:hypothetical protein
MGYAHRRHINPFQGYLASGYVKNGPACQIEIFIKLFDHLIGTFVYSSFKSAKRCILCSNEPQIT